jgi:hypothetical protein
VAGEQTAVLTGIAPDFPFQAHNRLASPVAGEGGEGRVFFSESQAHSVIPLRHKMGFWIDPPRSGLPSLPGG